MCRILSLYLASRSLFSSITFVFVFDKCMIPGNGDVLYDYVVIVAAAELDDLALPHADQVHSVVGILFFGQGVDDYERFKRFLNLYSRQSFIVNLHIV